MTAQTYWIGKTFVAEWSLTNTAGAPLDGATVAGSVTRPTGASASMATTAVGGGTGRYRATYDPTEAGLHAWRLVASGVGTGAEEGIFVVRQPLVGALPITRDPTTPVGRVRLLISDVDEANPLFNDAEITAFLAIGAQRLRLAAAEALDTMASNEVMVSKVIQTQDLKTDGSKVAAELRARATTLREQDANYDADGNLFGMDIVDFRPRNWIWPAGELAEPPGWCP